MKSKKDDNVDETLEKAFGRIMVEEERTFGGTIIFMYSGMPEFLKMIDSVYKKPPMEKIPIKTGMFMSGRSKLDVGSARVYLVWVSSSMKTTKNKVIPSFAHEVSHMVDAIIGNTGISDSAGETRAYLTGKYVSDIMRWLYPDESDRSDSDIVSDIKKGIAAELSKLDASNYSGVSSIG